jgi:hypothetical protein
MITELLPQRLLGLGLVEEGTRHPRATQPLLRLRDSSAERRQCGAGRRRLSIVRRSLRHHAVVRSHHQHLGRTLGAGQEGPLDRPLLRAEEPSAGASATSWPPAGRPP